MAGNLFSKVTSLFGGGSSPQPTTPLPKPPSDELAQREAQKQRAFAAKKKGRASTILAGSNDVGYSPAVKKLLGE